jgi:hypothetical protein
MYLINIFVSVRSFSLSLINVCVFWCACKKYSMPHEKLKKTTDTKTEGWVSWGLNFAFLSNISYPTFSASEPHEISKLSIAAFFESIRRSSPVFVIFRMHQPNVNCQKCRKAAISRPLKQMLYTTCPGARGVVFKKHPASRPVFVIEFN